MSVIKPIIDAGTRAVGKLVGRATPKEKAIVGATAATAATTPILLSDLDEFRREPEPNDRSEADLSQRVYREIFENNRKAVDVDDFMKAEGFDPYRRRWAMHSALKANMEAFQSSELGDDALTDEELYDFLAEQGIGHAVPRLPQAVIEEYRTKLRDLEELPDFEGKPEIDKDDPMWYHPDIVNLSNGLSDIVSDRILGDPAELVNAAKVITYTFRGSGLGKRYLSSDNSQIVKLQGALNEQARQALIDAGFPDANISETGTVEVIDPKTGEWTAYENPWYIDLAQFTRDNLGEVATGVMAGFAGAAVAAQAFPQSRAASWALSAGAAALGASAGDAYDVLRAASKLNTEIALNDLTVKMGDKALEDFAFAIGVQSAAAIAPTTLGALAIVWDRFVMGNKIGAFDGLRAATNLNDAQINDLMAKWERISGQSVRSDKAIYDGELTIADKEQAIQILALSEAGTLRATAAALRVSRTGGAGLVENITARAKRVEDELKGLTNDNIFTFVRDDLNSHVAKTNWAYDYVKSPAFTSQAKYRFDFSKIQSLKEFEKRTLASVSNYGESKFLAHDLENLRKLGEESAIAKVAKKDKVKIGSQVIADPAKVEAKMPGRSLADLIELRETVIRLSERPAYQANQANQQIAEATLKRIDKEIAAASKTFEGGATWHKTWKEAVVQMEKLKELETNVMVSALSNPNISKDEAVKAVTKALHYESAATYMKAMSALPPETRRGVENAVVKHYTDKATVELSSEARAIDFPKLASELNQLELTDPSAREVQRLVNDMADFYKLDTDLLNIAWKSPAATPTNNIATTFWGKVKMHTYTKLFQAWQAIAPTERAEHIALTMAMRQVMDNPLNAKAVDNLKDLYKQDPAVLSAIEEYAIAFAKHGKHKDYDKVPVHRVAPVGELNKMADTHLGTGKLGYIDKAQASRIAKNTGQKLSTQEVSIKTIARPEDLKDILGRDPTPEDFKDKLFMLKVQQHFRGLTVGDEVLLFK